MYIYRLYSLIRSEIRRYSRKTARTKEKAVWNVDRPGIAAL